MAQNFSNLNVNQVEEEEKSFSIQSPINLQNKAMNIEEPRSIGMVDEASTSLKHLDLPENIRMTGILSSQDISLSDQIQSDMAFVNKKIDKAKQSIS